MGVIGPDESRLQAVMEGWAETDLELMQEALSLASEALAVEEVPVGAVVVVGGRVIGRGYNRGVTDSDPSAHAEIVALREAGNTLQNYRLVDATVFVTLEPCLMCVGAMLHARIRRLVFGAYDAKAGAAGSVLDLSHDQRLNHRLEVNGGLLAGECSELLTRFFDTKRNS